MSNIIVFSWCVTWYVVFLMAISSAESSTDEYIVEAKNTCSETRETLSCIKYRALKYVSGKAGGAQEQYGNGSSRMLQDEDERIFKMVQIKNPEMLDVDDGGFFENSRQIVSDSELEKMFKFGKRQLLFFLRSHGISFGLPTGARAVTDDETSSILSDVARSDDSNEKASHSRGKKKKISILLPLLSLLGIAKVKLLLVPILLTVLFIKKILILGALFLPTILSTLKICKMNQPHHSSHQHSGAESNSEYGGGYGTGYSGYGAVGGTGFSKEWGASRAYQGHRTAMDRQNPRTLNDYQIPVMDDNIVYPTMNKA